jgi:uncharacterized protein involved in outer membrane biogenesis
LRNLLFALAFVVCAVLAAAVAAPWLIDASQYRTLIADRVSDATGREIAIDGPVSFVLLPSPRVRAEDVRIVAPEKDAALTLSAKSVEVDLGWSSLFGQALDISHLRVIEPRVTIIALPSAPGAAGAQLGSVAAVRIERTDIQNGRIVWRDPKTGTARTIEQLQATILASPLASSVRVSGSGVASAVPIDFDAVIGEAPSGKPNPVSLTFGVRPDLARATLRGTYDQATQALRGRVQLDGKDLFAAIETVAPVDPLFAGVTSQPFSVSGDLGWSPAGLAANDLALQLGELRATGAITATSGQTLAVDVALAMTTVDLDKLSRLERRAAAPAKRPPEGAAARIGVGRSRPVSPPAIDLAVDLGVEAVGLNGGTLRQLRLNAVMSRGDVVINQLSALLPGETEFSGFAQIALHATAPRVDGTLSARSDNLRGLLEWLGVETKDVPPGRLRRFDGHARIEGTPTRLELTNISLAFDATRATGGIAIALGKRLGLGADIRVDQLNLDGYALANAKLGQGSLLDGFDANLTFAAQTVTWAGESLSGVSLDALLQAGDVVLRSAVVNNLAGARLEARGKIAAAGRQPAADLDVALRANDPSRLLRLAELSALAPPPLAVNGKLRMAANGDLSLEAFELAYGDSRIAGRATLAGAPRRIGLDVSTPRLALDTLPRPAGDGAVGLGVDAKVRADLLVWGDYQVSDARIEARSDAGTLTTLELAGKVFDGTLNFSARPDPTDRSKLSGSLSLQGADLKPAAAALLNSQAITGSGDVKATFSAPARMSPETWSALTAVIEVTGRDGTLAGIDLPTMREMLDPNDPPADIVSVLGAGLHGGATPFSALEARARLKQGIMTLDVLRIATPVGEAVGGGSADLARGVVDLSLTVPVAGAGVPPMQLFVRGSATEANVALDFSQLQRYLMRRQAETPGQDGASQ